MVLYGLRLTFIICDCINLSQSSNPDFSTPQTPSLYPCSDSRSHKPAQSLLSLWTKTPSNWASLTFFIPNSIQFTTTPSPSPPRLPHHPSLTPISISPYLSILPHNHQALPSTKPFLSTLFISSPSTPLRIITPSLSIAI
jgi:hypothetical protein